MNEKTIWDFLLKKTGNPYGTAAIMGNLMAESSLNPACATGKNKTANYVSDADNGYIDFIRDGVAFGLVQWCYYSRKEGFFNYAKGRGKSVGDLTVQLEYLVKEMSEKYKTVWASVSTGGSIRAISDVVMLNYEKPSTKTEAAKKKRAGYGQKFFDQFAQASKSTVQETVKEQPQPSKETTGKKVFAKANVRIRSGDSTNFGMVNTLKKGESLEYVATSSRTGWYGVQLKDRVGWVSNDFSEIR